MAPLTDTQVTSLALVGERLADVSPQFALGGSALLAAHGLPVDVNDLDVLVWRADRAAVLEALAPLGSFAELPKRPPWTSDWLIAGDVGDAPVEVIADLGFIQGDVHYSIPEATSGTAGAEFPLSPLPYWYHLYSWYNPAKAELIGRVVPEAEREDARLEMIADS